MRWRRRRLAKQRAAGAERAVRDEAEAAERIRRVREEVERTAAQIRSIKIERQKRRIRRALRKDSPIVDVLIETGPASINGGRPEGVD